MRQIELPHEKRDDWFYVINSSCFPQPVPQVIYLLLDVMYSFPNKSGSSVESFPTAFAIPIGLVKLVQGLWLLDHRDHEVCIASTARCRHVGGDSGSGGRGVV